MVADVRARSLDLRPWRLAHGATIGVGAGHGECLGAALVWAISLPLLGALLNPGPLGLLDWAGVVLWMAVPVRGGRGRLAGADRDEGFIIARLIDADQKDGRCFYRSRTF
jgi:hypothetical protein